MYLNLKQRGVNATNPLTCVGPREAVYLVRQEIFAVKHLGALHLLIYAMADSKFNACTRPATTYCPTHLHATYRQLSIDSITVQYTHMESSDL